MTHEATTMDGQDAPPPPAEVDGTVLFSVVVDLLRAFRDDPNQPGLAERMAQSRRDLEYFHQLNPRSLPALRLLAELAQTQGDLAGARKYINLSEVLDPWNAEILIISESLYESEAEAEQHRPGHPPRISSEITSNVISTDLLIEKAMGSFRLGDMDRAYTLAKLAYRINPKEAHHLLDIWSIGTALDPQRTHDECKMLLAEEPDQPYVYLALGSVDTVLGRYDEAAAWLQKGISLKPDNPYLMALLLNELAYALAKQGAYLADCVRFARRALEIFPDQRANGFIRDTLGIIYLKKGDSDKAVRYLTEAVSKDPTVIPRFHLALAHLKQKNPAGALTQLRFIAAARPSLESPHAEEIAILRRVQNHMAQLENKLNLGTAQDTQDALESLVDLI